MVIRRGSGLLATAFLVSQQELVGEIARVEEGLSDAEVKLFQVRVTDLSKLTKLDFGRLGETIKAAQPLEELTDIHLW